MNLSSWQVLAEQRIKDAQTAGHFDNLPGYGKPIPGIDEPHDENWWLKAKLKREQLSVLPPALEIRVDAERTLRSLAAMSREHDVRQAIAALNARIQKASLAVTWGPPVDIFPLDVEPIVEVWRARRQPNK